MAEPVLPLRALGVGSALPVRVLDAVPAVLVLVLGAEAVARVPADRVRDVPELPLRVPEADLLPEDRAEAPPEALALEPEDRVLPDRALPSALVPELRVPAEDLVVTPLWRRDASAMHSPDFP